MAIVRVLPEVRCRKICMYSNGVRVSVAIESFLVKWRPICLVHCWIAIGCVLRGTGGWAVLRYGRMHRRWASIPIRLLNMRMHWMLRLRFGRIIGGRWYCRVSPNARILVQCAGRLLWHGWRYICVSAQIATYSRRTGATQRIRSGHVRRFRQHNAIAGHLLGGRCTYQSVIMRAIVVQMGAYNCLQIEYFGRCDFGWIDQR